MKHHEIIKDSLSKIFSGIQQLRKTFPIKEFTIDGRLVGDIGEVIVQRDYDVKLYDKLVGGYDGETTDGRLVQIKATFKNSLTFSKIPDYYLGIKINKDGTYTEIYNGPSKNIVEKYGHRKGFGIFLLSFPNLALKELSNNITAEDRIPKRRRNSN
jgi:hypothetical protein